MICSALENIRVIPWLPWNQSVEHVSINAGWIFSNDNKLKPSRSIFH